MKVFVVDHSNGRAIGFKGCAQKGASSLDSGAWDPTQEDEVHPFGEAPVICKNLRGRIRSFLPCAKVLFFVVLYRV